ncbi:MAG: Electron transfer [Planctomycetota bacterium]|nr:MAG: Electron transfer [Planctomycetota bacterium]
MNFDFDVIIVGAGPSGSALAALLGREGVRTLLLDRATFPREKLCGEYMSPGALGVLERLGVLDAVEALPHRKLFGHEMWSYDGVLVRGRYVTVGEHRPSRPYGLAVRRFLSDHVFFRNAASFPSVKTLENFRVDGLLREGGQVRGVRGTGPDGPRSFTARLVAGCDGINSVVARELGLTRLDDRFRKIALVGYWRGMEAGNWGEVHLLDEGYFAMAAVDDELVNINFVLDGQALKAAKGDVAAFYDAHVLGNRRLAARMRNAVRTGPVRATGPLARRNLGCVAPGAILCGDSAEFVDPVTGEGMFIALRSAEIAAELVVEALKTGDETLHLSAWPVRRDAEFAGRHRACRRVQQFLPRRWAVNAILRRLAARPDLADCVISMSGDYVPPEAVFNPRFILSFLNPFAHGAPPEPVSAVGAGGVESSVEGRR